MFAPQVAKPGSKAAVQPGISAPGSAARLPVAGAGGRGQALMLRPSRCPAGLLMRSSEAGQQETGLIAPASVHAVLGSRGRALDQVVRAQMEERFGDDFSAVRVHSGPAADRSARDVAANAYTVGCDIVFREGSFAPGTEAGLRLLAHELTHVLQQTRMGGVGSQAPGRLQDRSCGRWL